MRACFAATLALLVAPAFAQNGEDKPAEPAQAQAAGQPSGNGLHPRVKLETSMGDIVLELNAEKAPITVDNFIQYATADHYDGLIFHRVIPTFMIQGGGYTAEMEERTQGLRPPIRNEWNNGLKNERGTIAMARTGDPDSATAQFFINVVDNERLSQANPQTGGAGYAVFGKVVEGMDVVDKIKDTPTTSHPKLQMMGDVVPVEPVIIKNVEVLGPYDQDKVKQMIEKSQTDALQAVKNQWPADVRAFIEKTEKELGKPVQIERSGLAYFVLEEGSGEKTGGKGTAMVHYTGKLINGEEFDSSHNRGQPYPVNFARPQVIQGWVLTLRDMKLGEKRKVIIPPDLAYGSRGRGPQIPPNSYLVFDMELVELR